MGEAIVASARDAAFVAAVNGAAGATANPLGAIGSAGISAAALAALTAPGFPAAHSGVAGAPHDLHAALLRQALVAAQVQAAQQRQRMAALASATAGVGGDVNALINALLGPRDVNPALDPWKLVTAGSGAVPAGSGAAAAGTAPNPAGASAAAGAAADAANTASAAALFPGQASNATTSTIPLASLAALHALGGTLGVPGAATGADVSRGIPGSAPTVGGFPDDAAARAAVLFGARGGMGMPAGGAFAVNPSPFGVGAGTPPMGADARMAAAAALAAKGGGGGDDEAVAAAAAAFFAAMNANKQTAVEDTTARQRGRDSAASEDTDVGKEAAEEGAQPRKEDSVRSGVAELDEADAAEDAAPNAETPPVEAQPVVALPSNVATAVAGGGD